MTGVEPALSLRPKRSAIPLGDIPMTEVATFYPLALGRIVVTIPGQLLRPGWGRAV